MHTLTYTHAYEQMICNHFYFFECVCSYCDDPDMYPVIYNYIHLILITFVTIIV